MNMIIHYPENEMEEKFLHYFNSLFPSSTPVYLTGSMLKKEGLTYSSNILSIMVEKSYFSREKGKKEKGFFYTWLLPVPVNVFHIQSILRECKNYSTKLKKKKQSKNLEQEQEIGISDIDSLILSYFKEKSPGAILKSKKLLEDIFIDMISPNTFYKHIGKLEEDGKLKKIKRGEYVLIREKEEKPFIEIERIETLQEKIFRLINDYPDLVKSYFSVVEKDAQINWGIVDFFTPKAKEALDDKTILKLRDYEGQWGFETSLDAIDAVNLLRRQNFIDCQNDPTMKLMFKPVVVYYLITNFQTLNY